ncbi:amino acid ABC transporter permease [Streptomyces sp. SAS_270]|uniref:amino acid ABC transporter permease n=1 Tax=Streptomyces sp. SAS_270 TaxID=3412748 RepID=UPI00403C9786
MTANTLDAAALYDLTRPRPRPRRSAYGILCAVLILGLLAWILSLLFDTGQFIPTKWRPFEYPGTRELLLRGLGITLKAFGSAAVLSPALGFVLATGRLSHHRWVRRPATVVVEFFRALPVLVMIFFVLVVLRAQPLLALVAGLTLHHGSVLAEVFRSGVHCVDRGQREAALALGMRRTRVMSYVLVPQALRAVLPAVAGQLVVILRDTSLGFLITQEEFLHAGRLIASNLDYDLPFIPVVMVISPICIGMCMLLSRSARWVARRERRSPETEAVDVAPAEPGTLLPGGTLTPSRCGGVQ